MARTPASRAAVAVVLLLCVLGAGLRLRGIDFLLPHTTQRDGLVVFRQVELMHGATPVSGRDQIARFYPQLLARVVTLMPSLGDSAPARTLEQHLARASEPWVRIRIASVLLSLLIVPGTYALARLFLARGPALFAAALATTSLLHIAFSQQERPHGAVAALSLLAVLASVRMRRKPTLGAYALAGVAAALAIGTLHNGVFVLPSLVLAHVLREPGRARAWWLAVPLGLVLASLPLFYPMEFARDDAAPAASMTPSEQELDLSGHEIQLDKFNGSGFVVMLESLCSYDPALLALVGLGALALGASFARGRAAKTRERRSELLVVLAHPLPYALVFGAYAFTFERFLLPLMPYLACLSAWGASRALELVLARVRSPALARSIAWAAALAALAFPTAAAVKLGEVRAAPDTSTEAAAWVREHADPARDAIAAVPYLDLPLFQAERALEHNAPQAFSSHWLRYQLTLAPEEFDGPRFELLLPGRVASTQRALEEDVGAYLRSLDADFVVVRGEDDGRTRSVLPKVHAYLEREATRVFRATPAAVDSGENTNLGFRNPGPLWSESFVHLLFRARCMGPTVEIYALRR